MLRPATPLSIIFLAAFVLALLTTISTPIIKAIPLGSYGGYNFGVFGWCNVTSGECSDFEIGYDTKYLYDAPGQDDDPFDLSNSTRHSISGILIVHPIAAFLILVCFGLAVAAHFRGPSHSSKYLLALLILTIPTLIATLLAFLVDVLLFVPHIQWGGWIELAATILVMASTIVTCAMRRTVVSRKARKQRIAENADMNGSTYQDTLASEQFTRSRTLAASTAASDNFARADSPPPLHSSQYTGTSMNDGDKNGAQYATYEMQRHDTSRSGDDSYRGGNHSSNDDRAPLNPSLPTLMSESTYTANSIGPSPRRPSMDAYGNSLGNTSQGSLASRPSDGFPSRGGRGGYGMPPQRGSYGSRGGGMPYAPRGGPGGPMMPRGGYRGGPPPPGWSARGRGNGYGPPPMMMNVRGGRQGPGPTSSPYNQQPPDYIDPYYQQDDTGNNDPRAMGGQYPASSVYSSTVPTPGESYSHSAPGEAGIGQAIELDERHGGMRSPLHANDGGPPPPSMDQDMGDQYARGVPPSLQHGNGFANSNSRSDEHNGTREPATFYSSTPTPPAENPYNAPRDQWAQSGAVSQSSAPRARSHSRGYSISSDRAAAPSHPHDDIPLPPMDGSSQRPTGRLRSGSQSYIEDVDPRFTEPSVPDVLKPGGLGTSRQQPQSSAPPPTTYQAYSQGQQRSQDPQHLSSDEAAAGMNSADAAQPLLYTADRPHDTAPLASSFNRDEPLHEQEQLLPIDLDHPDADPIPRPASREPSLAASDATSHFTSISQRGINPAWRPNGPPGPSSAYGGSSGPKRRSKDDVLLQGNPDFALPSHLTIGQASRGRPGRGRGSMRGGGRAALMAAAAAENAAPNSGMTGIMPGQGPVSASANANASSGLTPGGRYPSVI